MNIKQTKEHLDELLPNYEYSLNGRVFMTEELQALASNHSRLLTAVKRYLEPQANDAQSEMVEKELRLAIEEAEK